MGDPGWIPLSGSARLRLPSWTPPVREVEELAALPLRAFERRATRPLEQPVMRMRDMVTVLSSAGGGGCALARHRCTVHADRAPAPGLASAWAPNVNRIFPLRISSYACRFADRTRWHR